MSMPASLERVVITPGDLIKGSNRLVPSPEVLLRVNALLENPRCPARAIGQVIGRDPVLTARLLRLANSSFYGFPSRIDTVSRAITVIGMEALRSLVLVTTAVQSLSRLDLPNMAAYWRHSLRVGLAARTIGWHAQAPAPEALFAAGLLHEIGRQIMWVKLPEIAKETEIRAGDLGLSIAEVEQQVLGFDHGAVGGELLRSWGLPPTLWEPVACHHRPEEAESAHLETIIVHAANVIEHVLEEESVEGEERIAVVRRRLIPVASELLVVDEALLERVAEEFSLNGAALEEILLSA